VQWTGVDRRGQSDEPSNKDDNHYGTDLNIEQQKLNSDNEPEECSKDNKTWDKWNRNSSKQSSITTIGSLTISLILL
jgi:hypothetical protein